MKRMLCLLLAVGLSQAAYAADKNQTNNDPQFDQQFDAVDTNHDGKISKSEAELQAPAVAEAFERIDTNHDGYLSKQEIKTFTAAMLKSRAEFNRRLHAADTDKNDKLSKEESKAIPILHDNFETIDTNHDGQLTGKEIAEFLRAQLKAHNAQAK